MAVLQEEVCDFLEDRPTCPRCGAYLRSGNTENPSGLCDPCLALVQSCVPFAGPLRHVPAAIMGLAPSDVNVLELLAGIILIHDALHRGEPVQTRDALAAYEVELDHVQIWTYINKLRRRHGFVLTGEPRKAGYALEDWTWDLRRKHSSLKRP